MHRAFAVAWFAISVAILTLPSTSYAGHPFAIDGRASAISAADIDSVVSVVAPNKVYRLRVISKNRVHVETSAYRIENVIVNGRFQMRSVPYLVVDRVGGHWKVTGRETTVLR